MDVNTTWLRGALLLVNPIDDKGLLGMDSTSSSCISVRGAGVGEEEKKLHRLCYNAHAKKNQS